MNKPILGTLIMASMLLEVACEVEPDSAAAQGSVRALANATCDYLARCCTDGELGAIIAPFATKRECTGRLYDFAESSPSTSLDLKSNFGVEASIVLPNPEALAEAVTDERVRISLTGLEQCLSYLGELRCAQPEKEDSDACEPIEIVSETPCDSDKLFIGRVREGGTCTSSGAAQSLECAPGLSCRANPAFGVQGRCVALSQRDEDCYGDTQCDEDLYCSLLDGTCQPLGKLGDDCLFADTEDWSPDADTGLLRCESGLSCDPHSQKCVAPCHRGATCSTDEDCDPDAELACIVGRCDEPRSEGYGCSSSEDCQKGLRCITDPLERPSGALSDVSLRRVCAERVDVGDSCQADDDCESGFCRTATSECAEAAEPGAPCPSGLDAACEGGRCVREPVSCAADTDCPESGVCDDISGQCVSYCVAYEEDGAECALDAECLSGACASSTCRTLPLEVGERCSAHGQCDSGFCSLETDRARKCLELPLELGRLCDTSDQCESGVCFASSVSAPTACVEGLGIGESCSESTALPCDPKAAYCDTRLPKPKCMGLKESGEACSASGECRGSCLTVLGHRLCSLTAREGEAVCDGRE